jgi:isopenicillin-N epimerase
MKALSRAAWLLDPNVTYLNHGSFGACPRPVLEAQQRIREELEREPVRFLIGALEPGLDRVRALLSERFGFEPAGTAFVPNATSGVATVLASLRFAAGDEILVTNHGYAACHNVVTRAASDAGASVVTAEVPFPLAGSELVLEAVLARVGPRTRLCVVDHVTSATALIFPVRELVAELERRGVDTLIDAAHVPGFLPLDAGALGAAYYVANFHKWLCAPKGAALLHVRADRRDAIRPLVASHGMTSPRGDRSRFLLEADWTGTQDPSAVLAIPAALSFLDGLLPGGLDALMQRNRALALRGRELLCERLSVPAPCPESMLGAMATLPLPASCAGKAADLNQALFERHAIECFTLDWQRPVLRLCAQAYNELGDYERLASAVSELLAG